MNTAIARQVGRTRTAVENTVEQAGIARHSKPWLTTREKKRTLALSQTRTGIRWTSTVEISKITGRYEHLLVGGCAEDRSETTDWRHRDRRPGSSSRQVSRCAPAPRCTKSDILVVPWRASHQRLDEERSDRPDNKERAEGDVVARFHLSSSGAERDKC